MARYVLVHGAWHGAWCWNLLAERLRAAGHEVVTFDLPSLGDDHTPLAEVTLQSWIDRTVAVLAQSPGPVLLVGHSMAGVVVTGAVNALPEKVAAVIYVTAFVPLPGESLFDLATRPEGAATRLLQLPTADGLATIATAETAGAAFYGCCPPAEAEAAIARLRPQALQPVLAPLPAASGDSTHIPRVYIECTEDGAIPIALQRYMAGRITGAKHHSLPTDHSPFVSMPDRLAQLLLA